MSINKERVKEMTKGNVIYLKNYDTDSCISCNKCNVEIENAEDIEKEKLIGICEVDKSKVDLFEHRCSCFI